MPALLALLSSIAWGLADFNGGLAARRVGALRILAVSSPAGALGLTLFALLIVPGTISSGVLWLSVYTAVVGTIAMFLLYAALAIGPMGIVSPLTALGGAAVPVVAGIVRGESLTTMIVIGMVLAVAAVILVSRESGPHARVTMRGLLLSAGAGLFIGLFLVGLGIAPEGSGVWVATFSRWWSTVGMVILTLILLARSGTGPWRPFPWLLATTAGVLDAAANGLFQLAAAEGELLVVGVIGSLYPAATLLLAHVFLHERMSRVQWTGVVLALGAAVALAV
jgi:drug/metabolite transporter (DMT)-like permease